MAETVQTEKADTGRMFWLWIGMLLPPIGIFAFMAYWRAGQVNVPAAGTLALGFAVGA